MTDDAFALPAVHPLDRLSDARPPGEGPRHVAVVWLSRTLRILDADLEISAHDDRILRHQIEAIRDELAARPIHTPGRAAELSARIRDAMRTAPQRYISLDPASGYQPHQFASPTVFELLYMAEDSADRLEAILNLRDFEGPWGVPEASRALYGAEVGSA